MVSTLNDFVMAMAKRPRPVENLVADTDTDVRLEAIALKGRVQKRCVIVTLNKFIHTPKRNPATITNTMK